MTEAFAALRRDTAGPHVLALIDLAQDAEVMLPVLLALRRRVRLSVVASRWLRRDHPAVERRLGVHGVQPRWLRRGDIVAGRAPCLAGVTGVLTASESSHPAHAAGHALARRANALGLHTWTLQHGLENVGLLDGGDEVFASGVMFSWHPPQLTAGLAADVRQRLRHVGRPAPLPEAHTSLTPCDVAVFENLHAERYDEADRAAFRAGVETLLADGASVLLKPHPAGRWSLAQAWSSAPNLAINAEVSAVAAVAAAGCVITTPSTVALDAVLAQKPVALAARGGEMYRPLPVLDSAADWPTFVRTRGGDLAEGRAFLSRVVQPGDATEVIAEEIARISAPKG